MFSFQRYLRLHIVLCSLASILLGTGCTTQFVTKRSAAYVTAETSTLFLFEESGRRYLLPVTGEGSFPAFHYAHYIIVKEPISVQTTKRTFKAPNDLYLPSPVKVNMSGTITVYDNLTMIDVSLLKTDINSSVTENSTYKSVVRIPYMTHKVMDLYNKAKTMSNDELMSYINSETYTSDISDRNIILSYLVDAGRISRKYRTQTQGIYFDERNITDHSQPLNFVMITDFERELIDKIKRYPVIVYDYGYLQ